MMYMPMQHVKIKPLDTDGVIVQIHISINGIFYEVSYFNNGEQATANLLASQIEPLT